jgi:PAS domain S-box-containing protein
MISKTINLLLVDDDSVDRRLVVKALNRFSHIVKFDIETAGTLSETMEHLSSGGYDVVLLDLTLPDSSGIDTVQEVNATDSNVPIVVLTGLSDERMALHAIEKGAADYLVKGKFSDDGLMRAIRYAIERKRPEQKLKNAAKEWRATFDSIADFISIVDKDFKITRVNRALSDAFGVRPQELIGRRCHNVYKCTGRDSASCPHLKTLKTRKASSLEFYEERLGIYLEVATSPIIDENGQITGSVHIAKDITERKRVEQERKEQARLKSEFVATVSHEIRTPLSIFKNIISNALAGVMGQLSPKLRENLEMANRTINRLTRIVSDFLDISKIEAGKMKLLRTQFDIQLAIADSVNRLGPLQALINLISNAIKFAPEDGHVDVRAEVLDGKVAVEVEDDGPGIGSSDLEKIFDRFVQIEKQVGPGEHGTGLGLSIAKEVVELHGGKIEVESEPGQGTTFTIFLPLINQYSCLAALSKGDEPQGDEAVQEKEATRSGKMGLNFRW